MLKHDPSDIALQEYAQIKHKLSTDNETLESRFQSVVTQIHRVSSEAKQLEQIHKEVHASNLEKQVHLVKEDVHTERTMNKEILKQQKLNEKVKLKLAQV